MKQKTKKMNRKKWIAVAAAATAAVLAMVFLTPFFYRGNVRAADLTTRTATVETGTIETTVVGSGNLASSQTLDIAIPSLLTVKQVLVEEGDSVLAGDALATLDPVALKSAILTVQDELAKIDGQIDDVKDDTESKQITASVNGRVKRIFAEENEDVGQTVEENGSLLVLSLDGTMKVTFSPSVEMAVGDDVVVTLSDGETVDGEVEAADGAGCTVTLTDNGPEYGESVAVATEDGAQVGTGTLEIGVPIEVIGGSGTIASVDVDLNESVSAGDTLITLTEAAKSREYEALLETREEYAAMLRALVGYAQTNTVTAPQDGVVSTVAVTGTDEAAATGNETTTSAMQAAPMAAVAEDGNAGDTVFLTATETASAKQDEMLLIDVDTGLAVPEETTDDTAVETEPPDSTASPEPTVTELGGVTELYINNPVTGNTPQTTLMPGVGYTGTVKWTPETMKFEQQTTYAASVTLQAAAGYRFAADAAASVLGAQVSNLTVSGESEANTMTFTATFQPTAAETSQAQGQQNSQMQGAAQASVTQASIVQASGGSGGGTTVSSAASSAADETDESEDTLTTTAFTLLTGGATSLTISVDELDILSIEEGQSATVTLDAIPDAQLTGTVVKISSAGNAQTGVTTYPVTLSLENPDGLALLAGMNASATIVSETSENVLTIPLDALQEISGEQFVYVVGSGAEEGGLGEKRAVETGLSDGTYVEIVSGLSEGEQVVYAEAQEAETETGAQPGFGGMQMPEMGGGPNGQGGGQGGPGGQGGGPMG